MGYTKVNTVRENNEFAVRGDIIDIFNSGKENPIRIYLNNDKIEKIRLLAGKKMGMGFVKGKVLPKVSLLSKSDNSWMTGNIIRIDGGEDIVG